MFHKEIAERFLVVERVSIHMGDQVPIPNTTFSASQTVGGNALDWDDRIVIDCWSVHRRGWRLYLRVLWSTFAQLLGKDASERYRVIMEEASEIDDLDV